MDKIKSHKYADIFPLMNDSELAALVESIKSGWDKTCPITIYEGKILDGRNRYKAALVAGVTPATTEYKGDDPLSFVLRHNLTRRHLNETQRAGVAAKIANMTRGGDKPSKKDSNFETPNLDNGNPCSDCGQKTKYLPADEPPDTNYEYLQCPACGYTIRGKKRGVTIPQAAEMMNVGKSTVAAYKAVAEAAPELVEKMDNGTMTVNAARTEAKRKQVKETLASIEVQETKRLSGVYDVIVIDPPWPMEKIVRDVAPDQVGFEYPVMTLDDIARIKIPAADSCHLFLWTTQKFLPCALDILSSWNAKYVCVFVWHKNGGFQPFGLPQYNCEFTIYGRIGTPSFIDFTNFMACYNADRKEHSAKPEEFYATLRRVTGGRRLDMFNRRKIDGFDGWGNQSK